MGVGGVAVLLDLQEYESLTERAAFVEAVEQGARAVHEADVHPHEEAAAILCSFGDETAGGSRSSPGRATERSSCRPTGSSTRQEKPGS